MVGSKPSAPITGIFAGPRIFAIAESLVESMTTTATVLGLFTNWVAFAEAAAGFNWVSKTFTFTGWPATPPWEAAASITKARSR